MTRPSFESRSADWLEYEEARRRIMARAKPGRTETVALDECAGRALAEDLTARITMPPWDNSAMDGYALRADDAVTATQTQPSTLRVVGESRAGGESDLRIEPGTAARIMTGAPVPRGADTVVRVEDTDERGDHVLVRVASSAGRNIRQAGEDFRRGELLVEAGTEIGPGHVALLAANGISRVPVGRRPIVAILSSGDELVPATKPKEALAGRAIVDSNTPMLEAMVRRAGAVPRSLGIARDDEGELVRHLGELGPADVLVTVGGASMGTHDLFKRVLDDLDYELDFWRVRIRPGSPVSLGTLRTAQRDIPVIGLPGNPGSAFVTFELFVRPFVRALAGYRRLDRPRMRATAGEALTANRDLMVFLRVRLEAREGQTVAWLTGPQGSGLVSTLAEAEGLALHRPGTERIGPGEYVDVLVLSDHWG
jgi:molybdopterin molybdotransferase